MTTELATPRQDIRYGLSVLLAMILVSITLNLVTLPFAQVATEISRTYGIDDVKFSLLIGLFFAVPVTLMSIGGGWLADHVSRRRVLVVAMVVWTAGAIWTALAPTYEQMALSRMVVAAAVGTKFPVAMTWINDAFPPHRRARAIGALFVILNIGPAIGASISGVILNAVETGAFTGLPGIGGLEPWRVGLLVLALISLLPLPWVALLKDARPARAEVPADVPASSGESFPVWLVAALVVSAALLSLADTANLGWLPTVLKRQYGFDAQEVGFTFALIVTVAGTLGPLAAGVLDDHVHKRHGLNGSIITCAIAAALCAPLLAAFAQPSSHLLIAALLVSGVISVMALTVGYVAIQSLLAADRRGTGTGLAHALENLARASAPTLVATVGLPFAAMPAGGLGAGVAIVCVGAFALAALLYAGVAFYLRGRRAA
jgi:MFS family permease